MKDKRFELRLSAKDLKSLDRLVKKGGYPSRAAWVIDQISLDTAVYRVGAKIKPGGPDPAVWYVL